MKWGYRDGTYLVAVLYRKVHEELTGLRYHLGEVSLACQTQATWPMMSQCLPRLQLQRVSDPLESRNGTSVWHVYQLKVSWVRAFAKILANSLSLCDCSSEIIFLLVMIVLGWMLFVGLASYMGTFPDVMVSTSLASQLLRAWLYAPVWDFWPNGESRWGFYQLEVRMWQEHLIPLGHPFLEGLMPLHLLW